MYGVTPGKMRWVIGGTDHPIPAFDWIPQPVPAGVDVRHAEGDQTLAAMLEAGEIDALLSVDVPQALIDGSTKKVRRLFPGYESVERESRYPVALVVMPSVTTDTLARPGPLDEREGECYITT